MKTHFDKIYVKDFDSNILKTDIPVVLEKIHNNDFSMETISLGDFSEHNDVYMGPGYRFINNDGDEAFQHARDYLAGSSVHPGPDVMIQQVNQALQGKDFSPSLYKFIDEVLKNGNLFAINTARGNSMDAIKQSIYLINQELLSDHEKKDQIEIIREKFQRNGATDAQTLRKYLDVNCYLPVSNREFCKLLHIPFDTNYSVKKTLAMDWYIQYITSFLKGYQTVSAEKKISLGFSDDTYDNIEAMLSYFLMIANKKHSPYDYYTYRLYFTGVQIKETQNKIENFLYENFNELPLDIEFEHQYSQKNIINPDILKISIEK